MAYLRLDAAASGPEAVLARADLDPAGAAARAVRRAHDRGPPPRAAARSSTPRSSSPTPTHPAHRLAAAHKRRFAERLGDLARAAGARQPEQVGRRLALLYDGAAAQAVVHDSADRAAEARAMAAAILREAIDAASKPTGLHGRRAEPAIAGVGNRSVYLCGCNHRAPTSDMMRHGPAPIAGPEPREGTRLPVSTTTDLHERTLAPPAREGPRRHHRRRQLRQLVRAGRPLLPGRRPRPSRSRA